LLLTSYPQAGFHLAGKNQSEYNIRDRINQGKNEKIVKKSFLFRESSDEEIFYLLTPEEKYIIMRLIVILNRVLE